MAIRGQLAAINSLLPLVGPHPSDPTQVLRTGNFASRAMLLALHFFLSQDGCLTQSSLIPVRSAGISASPKWRLQ